MGEPILAGTLALDWRVTSALFWGWGKVLEFLHLRREAIDSMKKQWNPGLGDNLEDLHELGYQRSAPRPLLLNSVEGENLEDLPEERECQRSARTQTLLRTLS